ncbi:MAG: hypothetical protein ACC628_03405 [Pirellulaceae bacterium]
METVFLVCAAVGGTLFVCQFVMLVIGIGADDLDFGDDIPDDMGGDFGDVHGDFGDVTDHQGEVVGHGSTWLFGVISIRTLVAAVTFFGLTGYASLQAGQSMPLSLIIAIGCGAAAMYGVHRLMRFMYGMGQDRTMRIKNAVGKRGTVYLPIPAANEGAGKVQINVQDRLAEYAAMTPHAEKLSTGVRIVVTRIISPTTVEVERIPETKESEKA